MTSTAADLDTAADTAAGVLAFARDRRDAADAAEAQQTCEAEARRSAADDADLRSHGLRSRERGVPRIAAR